MKLNILTIFSAVALTLCACSDDDVVLTTKDWDNTATYFASTDAAHLDTYYQPQVGYVGDPMPFYDPVQKDYKIFYLQEYRPNSNTYHPFWCLQTSDGATYESLGELISTGSVNELDGALGTGCTVYNEADKTYYTFYTAHSANLALTGINEAIMVAKSQDFKTWTKDRSFILSGEGEYSTNDFRDPAIFKTEDGVYHMVIATQRNGKGTLAEYTSTDLKNWKSEGMFMNMMWDRFYECPDVFKMGEWWYLVYSEKHAAVRKVQYFKGRTLEELKASTLNDAGIWPDDHEGFLNSRSFYAGKTASDGDKRYIWGWCPTRPGNDNINVGAYPAEPEWAGALVAHELLQNEDGTLTLGAVKAIENKFNTEVPVKVMAKSDNVTVGNGNYELSGDSYVLFNRLNSCNKIEFTVTASSADDKFGISFVRGTDSKKYYTLVVNPEGSTRRKINFEEEGEEGTGFVNGGDGYLFSTPADNVYNVVILTDNSVCNVYINNVAAHTIRLYGIQKNCWSINNYGGNIAVSGLKVSKQ
ncbi:MAG: glycoside hydrolase domain-containing protein [Muribaculaceae bacterium]